MEKARKPIDSFLKENSKHELNIEELDQVVGGAFNMVDKDHCNVNGQIMTVEEFEQSIYGICKEHGINVAKNILYSTTGYWGFPTGGKANDMTELQQMQDIMNQFWTRWTGHV